MSPGSMRSSIVSLSLSAMGGGLLSLPSIKHIIKLMDLTMD